MIEIIGDNCPQWYRWFRDGDRIERRWPQGIVEVGRVSVERDGMGSVEFEDGALVLVAFDEVPPRNPAVHVIPVFRP